MTRRQILKTAIAPLAAPLVPPAGIPKIWKVRHVYGAYHISPEFVKGIVEATNNLHTRNFLTQLEKATRSYKRNA